MMQPLDNHDADGKHRDEDAGMEIVTAIKRDLFPDMDTNDGGQILVWILELCDSIRSESATKLNAVPTSLDPPQAEVANSLSDRLLLRSGVLQVDLRPLIDAEGLGLSIDMMDADRLRDWARLLLEHGPNISYWGDRMFVVSKLQTIATGIEKAVRDIGTLRALSAALTQGHENGKKTMRDDRQSPRDGHSHRGEQGR